jgi:hypothetical protein
VSTCENELVSARHTLSIKGVLMDKTSFTTTLSICYSPSYYVHSERTPIPTQAERVRRSVRYIRLMRALTSANTISASPTCSVGTGRHRTVSPLAKLSTYKQYLTAHQLRQNPSRGIDNGPKYEESSPQARLTSMTQSSCRYTK